LPKQFFFITSQASFDRICGFWYVVCGYGALFEYKALLIGYTALLIQYRALQSEYIQKSSFERIQGSFD